MRRVLFLRVPFTPLLSLHQKNPPPIDIHPIILGPFFLGRGKKRQFPPPPTLGLFVG